MTDIDDEFARMRRRDRRYEEWIEELRIGDPAFAEASALHAVSHTEWQSAAFLLCGLAELWRHFGAAVLAEGSIAPVVLELEQPSRGWSTTEREAMRWASHFWNEVNDAPGFPTAWDEPGFRRWINACFIRHKMAPDPVS